MWTRRTSVRVAATASAALIVLAAILSIPHASESSIDSVVIDRGIGSAGGDSSSPRGVLAPAPRPVAPTGARPNGRPAVRECTVFDLATGEDASDVPFEVWVGGARAALLHSDSRGRIEVRVGPGVRLVVTGREWLGTWAGHDVPQDGDHVWVYRTRRVAGRVVAAAAEPQVLDPRAVEIRVCMIGTDSGAPGAIAPDPWNGRWARSHGLWNLGGQVGVEPDGRFDVSVPWVRGLVVRATASGWMPGWTDIPDVDGELVRAQDIELRRAIRVKGTVVDETGDPLRGVRLSVLLTQRFGPDEPAFDVRHGELVGWNVSAGGNAGGSVATYVREVRSDAAGEFDFEYATHGELLLVAEAPTRSTARLSLGALRADPPPQRIRLSRVETEDIRFHDGGSPLANWSLTVTDLMGDPEGMEPQPSSTVRLSADGSATGTLLEPGRDYYVHLTPPGGARCVQFPLEDWDGIRSIDVAARRR